jgi:Cyclin, N-terminal domain
MVDLFDRLDVMFQQEKSSYRTEDYLDPSFQQELVTISDEELTTNILSATTSEAFCTSMSSGINDVWREKICEWSYQVIDHFDFSREVVSVSINYLDRFLASRRVNKKVFQLAAMTTLFLAIKLFEPGRLAIQSMTELSRGYFSVDQMIAMEACILRYDIRSSFFSVGILLVFRLK